MFDEDRLESHAGLVPVMELAEQVCRSRLFEVHVRLTTERVGSGANRKTED